MAGLSHQLTTLAELHVSILTSSFKIDKALTKFNKALTKPYHGLVTKPYHGLVTKPYHGLVREILQ